MFIIISGNCINVIGFCLRKPHGIPVGPGMHFLRKKMCSQMAWARSGGLSDWLFNSRKAAGSSMGDPLCVGPLAPFWFPVPTTLGTLPGAAFCGVA